MKQLTNDVFDRFSKVSEQVVRDFRQRGIVIPQRNPDGSVTIGKYTVVKKSTGFYAVLDGRLEIVVDDINLPQTATIVANDLALGRWVNDNLLKQDKEYGFALFEETLYKRSAERSKGSYDKFEIMMNKYHIKRLKKNSVKTGIVNSFEKLRKLV
jgi:hypothetical protein